jgi:hypothetical protein
MQNEQEPMALPWSVVIIQPRALVEKAIKPSVLSIGSFRINGPSQNQGNSRYHIYDLYSPIYRSHDPDDPDRDPYEPHEPWMRDTRVCVLTVSSEGTTTRLTIESPANHGSAEVFLYAFAGAMRRRGIPIDRLSAEPQEGSGKVAQPRESLRRLHSPQERRKIARHFWRDMEAGRVANRDGWAKANYGISDKTLRKYLGEFPDAP